MSIHYIKKEIGLKNSGFIDRDIQEVGYTIACKKIEPTIKGEDNPDCLCKMLTVDDNDSWYVKCDKYGNAYNPWSSMTNQLDINRRASYKDSMWVYKNVTQECFDIYMKFLKTRNANYHRTCERLIKNG